MLITSVRWYVTRLVLFLRGMGHGLRQRPFQVFLGWHSADFTNGISTVWQIALYFCLLSFYVGFDQSKRPLVFEIRPSSCVDVWLVVSCLGNVWAQDQSHDMAWVVEVCVACGSSQQQVVPFCVLTIHLPVLLSLAFAGIV